MVCQSCFTTVINTSANVNVSYKHSFKIHTYKSILYPDLQSSAFEQNEVLSRFGRGLGLGLPSEVQNTEFQINTICLQPQS